MSTTAGRGRERNETEPGIRESMLYEVCGEKTDRQPTTEG